MKLQHFLCFLLISVATYSQNPPENITRALGKVSNNFSAPPQAQSSGGPQPFRNNGRVFCCSYQWIFAIDASTSMRSRCLWFVYYLRWVFKTYFFDPVNAFLPCQQRVSTFGYNHRIVPPAWGSYESLQTSMSIWFPPIPDVNSRTTDFNLAILKALTLVW